MRVARLLVLAVSLLASRAAAEPPVHFKTTVEVTTENKNKLSLPPGYYLKEPDWDKLDLEVKRLQTTETRLKAENKSLRSSTSKTWLWAASVFAGGIAVGLGISFAAR